MESLYEQLEYSVEDVKFIFRLFNKTKTKKNQFFSEVYCRTRWAVRCVILCSVVNFVVQVFFEEKTFWENSNLLNVTIFAKTPP